MAAEVVVRVQDEDPVHHVSSTVPFNGTGPPPYPIEEIPTEVIVRAEEVLLVVLVLMIWVAAVALFFNRWGKIRMLEPYQPKFQQQHRNSDSVISPQVSIKSEPGRIFKRMKHQRMSFSKYNVNCLGDGSLFTTLPSPNALRRPRQNSVFVGSSTMAVMNPPRRVKSAIDIQHMVLSDYSPGSLSGCSSLLPMVGNNRRPSITIEKPCHRASINLDSVPLYHQPPTPKSHLRRPSCFIDNRPTIGRHHKHFISFDQPTTSWDRRTSITIDRPSSVQRPNTVFDRPCVSLEQPSLIIEPPSTSQEYPPTSIADGSSHGCCGRSCPEYMVSLHQLPSTSQARRPSFHLDIPPPASPNRHRLSVSLDHTACIKPTPSLKSPISASFDETQMKLSNLEFSKVSDV